MSSVFVILPVLHHCILLDAVCHSIISILKAFERLLILLIMVDETPTPRVIVQEEASESSFGKDC